MKVKLSKYLVPGILALLLLLIVTSVAQIRPDNTLYPLYNYFAFEEDGAITEGLHNHSYVAESGLKIHEVTSEQNAYKFRFIFSTPDHPFEILSLRVRMIFTEETTRII
ncbi:MAG: hypothetical protein JSV04_09745, partial [Candidatus Heimdallarchaeota archaeon]